MTDNEKAATFIGWKPFDGTVDSALARVDCGMPLSAPDMSDPRNYMKALEGLADRIHPILGIRPDTGKWTCYFLERQYRSRLSYREGASPGEAAVSALAALYDAEHPSEVKP